MATNALALPAPLADLRRQFDQRWAALAQRERRGLTAALVLVGVLVVWLIAVQPAWRTLRAAPAQLDALDSQWQQMQRLAAESRELRSAPAVAPAQAGSALKAATDRLGDRAKLTIAGDRATLTLTGITGSALSGWLGEARSAARARPIEAQLTRGPQGYAGTLIVQLGGTP